MVRALILLWALPIILFGIWYGLSVNDINFGTLMFSRAMYDHIFALYSNALGVSPQDLPTMILKAVITDTVLVFTFIAWRKRSYWWPTVSPYVSPTLSRWFGPFTPYWARMTESLSKNPWRIRLAATWSTFAALFRRDKSASSMERSAATVVNRSSQ